MSSNDDASLIPQDKRRETYRFVTIESPTGIQDVRSRKLSRTHAVRYALQHREKRTNCDFRIVTPGKIIDSERTRRRKKPSKADESPVGATMPIPLPKLSPSPLSTPGHGLEWDYRKLQGLLACESARDAGIPVFSINTAVAYQNFSLVFATGLQDLALVNALLYCLTFSLRERVNAECIDYKHKAIQHLNRRLSESKVTTDSAEVTIKAILLLVGVESRLGLRSQVQLHMSGVSRLMQICQSQQVPLSDGLKRSIFWRDLDSSLLTGARRLFSHETFPELHWQRDPFLSQSYTLPCGFSCRSNLFTPNFLHVLEDMQAMQVFSNSPLFNTADFSLLFRLDNQQAWQESRILDMMQSLSPNDHWLKCCHWAAYLCSYVMFTSIWESRLIPSYCSTQLLRHLQASSASQCWVDHEDLLTWVLFVGAAYAPSSMPKAEYATLITGDFMNQIWKFTNDWQQLEKCVEMFIWPRSAFQSSCRRFWEETCICSIIPPT